MKNRSFITAILAAMMMVTPSKMSAQEDNGFKSDVPKQMYANFPAGIHSMYIGEVINAWKK